ncbi:Nnf1-domain-containing protein [Phyllosticta citriasiana]|uniref:Nnf1-domain-containing protein n=1 Tax=Phyllosticta citriasiana TaxID=595635 RepID=A0ABR1KH93_9PEZI
MPAALNGNPTGDQPATSPSPSPSPPPAPPVAQTPGKRAQALQQVFSKAVQATLDRCSYSNFASCFPTPAQYVPEALGALHRDFTSKIASAASSNFDHILASRNVVYSLNSLDTLVDDAKKRKQRAEADANGAPVEPPTPPHTLPAQTLILAHLQPFLAAQTTSLEDQLATMQQANKALLSDVLAQRAELEALTSGLERVVADLQGTVDMLSAEEVQNLTTEVLDIDSELSR